MGHYPVESAMLGLSSLLVASGAAIAMHNEHHSVALGRAAAAAMYGTACIRANHGKSIWGFALLGVAAQCVWGM